MRVGGQDPPVAHDERDAGRVEAVLEELERPAEVALPAVGVPGQEQVEGAGARLGEHLGHRRRAPDRGAAVGDLEHEARVDQAVALDEAVLLLALARRAVAVVLAGGGLADPAGDPQPADVVERAGQPLEHARFPHAAPVSRFASMATILSSFRAAAKRRPLGPDVPRLTAVGGDRVGRVPDDGKAAPASRARYACPRSLPSLFTPSQ